MPAKRTTRGGRSGRRSAPVRGGRSGRPVRKRKIGRKILALLILFFAGKYLIGQLDLSGLSLPFSGAVPPDSVAEVARDSLALRSGGAEAEETEKSGKVEKDETAEPLASIEPLVETVKEAPGWAERMRETVRGTLGKLFRVRQVRLSGALSVNADTLLARIGDLDGRPMFELDLAELAASVESHPRVASAELVRRLPGTVHVSVRERRELALLVVGGEVVGVDRHGVVLAEPEPGWPLDVPLVTGLSPQVQVGDTVQAEPVRQAIDWLRHVSHSTRVGSWVSEVHVRESGVAWVCGINGWRVRPGSHPLGAQVATLDAFLEKQGFEDRNPRTLDLRFPGFLIVRQGI